jgi:uncharacterized protein (UPF0297 family)
MTDNLKELIESRIYDIDKKDYAAIFIETIQQDTMLFNSTLTEEFYDLLDYLSVSDTDIRFSNSNNTEVLQELDDKLKRKGYSDIKPLVGYMFADGGSDKTYYDLIALVKHNDNVFKKYASLTCGDDLSYKNEDQIFEAFIEAIIYELKGY